MSESTQAQPASAGRREMMFCHECHDEWYRDEHGIICPECDSEFTEIIEEGNDPRDHDMFDHEHSDDDDDSMPSLEEADPNHPLHNHNPFRDDDDPPEADISSMRFRNVGPGHFHVQATIHRTISPAAFGPNGNGPTTMGGITSFLTNLLQRSAQQQPQAEAGDGQGGSAPRSGPGGAPHVHRFTYSSGARLSPRDGDNPGPRLEPVDDINNVLASLFAAFGDPARGGAGQDNAHDHEHDFGTMPINPLLGFLAAVGAPGGQHGDFVTSQEAMDRIISQLMEQTATSNAPGPASQADIDALPRKKVTTEMLGSDGKADCSICMDEVMLEEEVTELPCRHWFHHQCVSAWLKEHDTCPHCRKGITKTEENASRDASSGNATSSARDPVAYMPGAFGIPGEGNLGNPFRMAGLPGNAIVLPRPPTNSDNDHLGSESNSNEDTTGGGGDGDRARRSWWP
ncbi:hypothetical protein N0V90_011437 [Kalmusia sp. IMI 367209]|nr:hypothetical protein N0V90_011437 [Kalmusia sp. IMI 367209]